MDPRRELARDRTQLDVGSAVGIVPQIVLFGALGSFSSRRNSGSFSQSISRRPSCCSWVFAERAGETAAGSFTSHQRLSGSVLSFASSLIQFMRISINKGYFNHNALAHVVQAAALVLLFVGIRHAQAASEPPHLVSDPRSKS